MIHEVVGSEENESSPVHTYMYIYMYVHNLYIEVKSVIHISNIQV